MAKRSKTSANVERRNEISAGGLIWRRDSAGDIEVVLVKPAGKDFWALPKGHLEEGESVPEAAVREVREETGLTVSDVRPLGVISYIFSHHEDPSAPLIRIFKRVHFFLMEMRGGDTSAHDTEIDEVKWMSLDEAIKRASFDNERKLIAKAAEILTGSPKQSKAR
jgi:8-oxo-dGTP pyrophosphatase MutT (NUDIX family)